MNTASENDPLDLVVESFLGRLRAGERDDGRGIRRPAPATWRARSASCSRRLPGDGGRPPTACRRNRLAEVPPERLRGLPHPALPGGPRRDGCGVRGGAGVARPARRPQVLPPLAAADPGCLERFQREARPHSLHHSNIVPVFGVGEDGGVHYYAMQFIPGRGLDVVLGEVLQLRQPPRPPDRRRGRTRPGCRRGRPGRWAVRLPPTTLLGDPPTPSGSVAGAARTAGGVTALTGRPALPYFRSVARIGLQAAEALAYAHRQGCPPGRQAG